MKQTVLSLLLAMVLMLSACAKPPAETTAAPTTVPETTVAASTAAPTPENQELRVVLETDGSVVTLSGTDDLLAVMLMDGSDHPSLVTLDPATGRELGRAPEDPYADLMAFSGGVATFSWNSNTVSVYSPAMEPLWTRTLSDGTYGNLQSDGHFYLLCDDGTVVRLSLADQSEQVMTVPAGLTPLDVFQCLGSRSLLRCTNAEDGSFRYLWLDWDTGAAEFTDGSDESFFSRLKFYDILPGSNCAWLRALDSDTYYCLPGTPTWGIQSSEDIMLAEMEGHVLTFCDLHNGTSARRTTTGVTAATYCGSWVAYVETDAPGQVTLWNTALSAHQIGEEAFRTVPAAELAEENLRMADAITADTGMPVFLGEAGTDYNSGTGSGYVSDAVTDVLIIHRGLEQLQLLTESYPDGMFREMCTDAFQPIEVYLCGAIHGDVYGFEPIAFTTYTGDAQIVVLDIGEAYDLGSFRATIAHEFMHVMENRINQHGWDTGLDYLSYWMSFVPDAALYFYNYNDYLDFDQNPDNHTVNGSVSPEEIYFLDAYSRTMPTEDRARILEHLILGEASSYADALQNGVLREKAAYLCALIRECFPSCQIDGKLPWEEAVEIVPFSDYEAAVRDYVPQALG